MTHQVSILRQARQDFEELRAFVLNNCPDQSWKECQDHLKSSIANLQIEPDTGSVPMEIIALNLQRYRQIVSGKLRIIYEIRPQQIFIHVILDHRRDLNSLLFRRLMRMR